MRGWSRAQDWRWSSVRAHLAGEDDATVTVAPILPRCAGRFAELIATGPEPAQTVALRAGETIGRPLGGQSFFDEIAALTGRNMRPGKRRPKAKGLGGAARHQGPGQ